MRGPAFSRRASLAALVMLLPATTLAQRPASTPEDAGGSPVWFAALALGYGRLDVDSDQTADDAQGAFTLSLRGGRAFGERVRVGLDVAGWLIEAGNTSDPSKGASVSVTNLFVQYLPATGAHLYLEGGAGFTHYTDNAPDAFGADGLGWTLGAGFERVVSDQVRLVPSVQWSGGRFRDTRNMVLTRTGLGYGVVDVRIAALVRFGRRDSSLRHAERTATR